MVNAHTTALRSAGMMVALLIGMGGVAACGSSDDGKTGDTAPPTASESTPDSTADAANCESIWVAGQTLPENYSGCDGAEAIDGKCQDGSTYYGVSIGSTEMFAVAEGEIVDENATDAEQSAAYSKFTSDCLGY